jgi:hypothetical protein
VDAHYEFQYAFEEIAKSLASISRGTGVSLDSILLAHLRQGIDEILRVEPGTPEEIRNLLNGSAAPVEIRRFEDGAKRVVWPSDWTRWTEFDTVAKFVYLSDIPLGKHLGDLRRRYILTLDVSEPELTDEQALRAFFQRAKETAGLLDANLRAEVARIPGARGPSMPSSGTGGAKRDLFADLVVGERGKPARTQVPSALELFRSKLLTTAEVLGGERGRLLAEATRDSKLNTVDALKARTDAILGRQAKPPLHGNRKKPSTYARTPKSVR